MGTWEGHISPGVAFYSFGIVFCFQNSWLYFTRGRKFHRSEARSNSSMGRIYGKIKHFPIDSFLKILYGVGAAMAELFYPPGTNKLMMINADGKWTHLNEWQHFTMYSFFAINGVIDIISQKFMKKRAIVLEKAAVAIAFYITALLLFYHRHGKHELELESHELLLYANLGMCVTLTLEVWKPFDQRLVWLHTLLVMQMGSWLFHLAFILFRPPSGVRWDSDDHLNLMVLPIFYAWHIFFNICVMSIIHLGVFFYYKHKVSSSYSALDSNELQCCMPSNCADSDSTNGGTFSHDIKYGNRINEKGDTRALEFSIEDDETPFMT